MIPKFTQKTPTLHKGRASILFQELKKRKSDANGEFTIESRKAKKDKKETLVGVEPTEVTLCCLVDSRQYRLVVSVLLYTYPFAKLITCAAFCLSIQTRYISISGNLFLPFPRNKKPTCGIFTKSYAYLVLEFC